jgi:hypothetical protein
MHICLTPGCGKNVNNSRYCSRCRTRKSRQNNLLRYWFLTLKNNAKRRGKRFTLTLQQFTDFCKETGYAEGKGIKADSLTVDRIDENGG